MGSKKVWLLVVFLMFLIVLAIALGSLFIYLMNAPESLAQGTVLELSIGGTLAEVPADDPWTMLLESTSLNLWDLRRCLESAANDPPISAIYLEISPMLAGWAQVEETRALMKHFRESGKQIHAFLGVDIVGEKELYLASAADRISVTPGAGFLINGLAAEVVFMKRTMDKLGIKPQFIQFKEFKTAETYTREKMTPEIRQMLTTVLEDIQNRFVESVCSDRGIEKEKFLQLLEKGLLSGLGGTEAGLADELEYEHQVREHLKALAGTEKYRSISTADYLERVPASFRGQTQAKVALVGAVGTIVTGRSDGFSGLMGATTMSSRLRQLRNDPTIDGVILRVNSPGGSAAGSDMIWEEVRELEENGTPVVVSMSSSAASGGYYVSMAARHIVALPSTITGSIGVLFGKFDVSGFYDWLGMDVDRIKLSPNSDLFSLMSSLTAEQEDQVRQWIESTYISFVTKAAEGRDLKFEELEPKARGRIYTGVQAVEAGLVDSVGGLSEAIAEMKKALDLEEADLIRLELYPRPKTLWQALASGDLLKLSAVSGFTDLLRGQLRKLESPSLWMLAPEVRFD